MKKEVVLFVGIILVIFIFLINGFANCKLECLENYVCITDGCGNEECVYIEPQPCELCNILTAEGCQPISCPTGASCNPETNQCEDTDLIDCLKCSQERQKCCRYFLNDVPKYSCISLSQSCPCADGELECPISKMDGVVTDSVCYNPSEWGCCEGLGRYDSKTREPCGTSCNTFCIKGEEGCGSDGRCCSVSDYCAGDCCIEEGKTCCEGKDDCYDTSLKFPCGEGCTELCAKGEEECLENKKCCSVGSSLLHCNGLDVDYCYPEYIECGADCSGICARNEMCCNTEGLCCPIGKCPTSSCEKNTKGCCV